MNRAQMVHLGLIVTASAFGAGCSVLEWAGGITRSKLESSDMKPYLAAVHNSNRTAHGFTQLPTAGPVRVEVPRSKKYYDVMLHIDRGHVSRTVDFLLVNGKPVWSGEQEIHFSGREFETVDGTVQEFLVISYSTVSGSGTPKGGYVDYWGQDEALKERSINKTLSVADVKKVWDTWPK